jgi:D-alanyl-D-alanine carboxypeptidase
VQVSVKNVYGNLMVYPANQVAHDLADLLGVKTFTNKARDQLKKLGYEFVRVNNDGVKL